MYDSRMSNLSLKPRAIKWTYLNDELVHLVLLRPECNFDNAVPYYYNPFVNIKSDQ